MQMEAVHVAAREGIGQALRARRLARGLGVGDVAAELRLPPGIVEAMENEDRVRLGAAVFARGRVGSYARWLGIPMELVDVHFPPDVVVSQTLAGRASKPQAARRTIAITGRGALAAIAVAVAIPMISLAARQPPQGMPKHLALLDPSVASHHDELQLRFSGDNWVDVLGANGRVIERGRVPAGSVRQYRTSAVARVAIADPASVVVLRDGEPVDLTPFRGADRTRFALSSAGQPTPVRD